MTHEEMRDDLVKHLTNLDETRVLALVQQLIDEGVDLVTLLKDCERGMLLVGERYAARQYYLSGLIMAGEIFREVMVLTQPLMTQRLAANGSGRIVLGTVEGDIHDIGKSAAAVALRCYGFTVEDLGVDVPPAKFLRYIEGNPPDVVGLSGLITLAHGSMKETIELIRSQTPPGHKPIPVIIGGTTLSDRVCSLVGADFWANDAMEGVRICQSIMEKKGR